MSSGVRLPIGWSLASLMDVTAEIASVDPRAKPDRTITYFDIGSIDSALGVVKTPKLVKGGDAPSRARQPVEEGDVLFSTVRPYLRAVAQVPRSTMNGVASTGFCVLRGEGGVSSNYLFHLARSEAFIKALEPFQRGTSYPAVRDGDVLSQPLPLAPSAEQRRIVDKLEELLSDLDAGVAELRAAQAKLKLYRQSLLKAAVTGELTAEWRKRQRLEVVAPSESTAVALPAVMPDVDSVLRTIPDDWVWTCAAQLCGFITKGTTPPKELKDADNSGVPFIRVTNLTSDGSLDLSEKVFVTEAIHRGFLKRSIVYPGDVLMNIVGPPLGQVSVVPGSFDEWNVNQAVAIFRPSERITVSFLSVYLLSSLAQQWLQRRAKTTAGQTNLTLELCRRLPVPVPSLSEQHAISAILAEQLDGLAMQEQAVRISLRQSAAQRKNILRAAFSGQLVPQDPNDEPAGVLLERIRASREGNNLKAARRPRSRPNETDAGRHVPARRARS